jgi:Zn-dependent protease with chaperone function
MSAPSAKRPPPHSISTFRSNGRRVVEAHFFDGRSTRIRVVNLSAAGEEIVIVGNDINLRAPIAEIQVDERLGRAARRLRLKDGSFCEVRDLDALDILLASIGHRDGRIDRMQRQAKYVLIACVAFLVLAIASWKWGLPWAAAVGARHLPTAVGEALSVQTLKLLDGQILMPSKLPLERRQVLDKKFHALLLAEGGTANSPLLFRRSPQLGANAFTLPNGSIVVLDDLITAIDNDPGILAVLSHELGHAHGRHGLQLLLQSSAVGAFLTLYIGDISNLLAAAPAAILQARYSQDLERQADDYGASLLLRNGMSPLLLADALKKLSESHSKSSQVSYLSSHPPTEARMRHLRILAARSIPKLSD